MEEDEAKKSSMAITVVENNGEAWTKNSGSMVHPSNLVLRLFGVAF
jgi:hypothetical protein